MEEIDARRVAGAIAAPAHQLLQGWWPTTLVVSSASLHFAVVGSKFAPFAMEIDTSTELDRGEILAIELRGIVSTEARFFLDPDYREPSFRFRTIEGSLLRSAFAAFGYAYQEP